MTDVPTVKFNFVPISGLQDVAKDATCGVLTFFVSLVLKLMSLQTSSGSSRKWASCRL